MIDSVIAQFGESMSIPDLKFNSNGVIHLTIANIGNLYIERHGEKMLIYLTEGVTYPSLTLYRKVLELCHYRENLIFPVNASFHTSGKLIFSVLLKQELVTLPAINQIIYLLSQLHEKAKKIYS